MCVNPIFLLIPLFQSFLHFSSLARSLSTMADWEHKITFDPPKYVKFRPANEKQARRVTIKNTYSQSVMFKIMTNSNLFSMNPVFFSIQPHKQESIKFFYAGCAEGATPNLKDKVTVKMAIVPKDAPHDWDVEKAWEDQKMQVELADSVKKRVMKIHYHGYEVPADAPEKSGKSKTMKGRKEDDVKKLEREKMAAATVNGLAEAAGQPDPLPYLPMGPWLVGINERQAEKEKSSNQMIGSSSPSLKRKADSGEDTQEKISAACIKEALALLEEGVIDQTTGTQIVNLLKASIEMIETEMKERSRKKKEQQGDTSSSKVDLEEKEGMEKDKK